MSTSDLWRFTSTIECPDGYRIEVNIEVPDYKDVRDQSEVAQMTAIRALAIHTRNANYANTRDDS